MAHFRNTPEEHLQHNLPAMLKAARRIARSEDDALDAVQAASERYLRHHQSVTAGAETPWLIKVAKREALRQLTRSSTRHEVALDVDIDDPAQNLDELYQRQEQVEYVQDALGRIKPQERKALLLQADGHSYDEIADDLQWTRTKVNRNISEGRTALKLRLSDMEAGAACAASKPKILRLVKGGASEDDLVELHRHLKHCRSCRADLRRNRGGIFTFMPAWLLGTWPLAARDSSQLVAGRGEAKPATIWTSSVDRLTQWIPQLQTLSNESGSATAAAVAAVVIGAGTVAAPIALKTKDEVNADATISQLFRQSDVTTFGSGSLKSFKQETAKQQRQVRTSSTPGTNPKGAARPSYSQQSTSVVNGGAPTKAAREFSFESLSGLGSSSSSKGSSGAAAKPSTSSSSSSSNFSFE